MEPSINKPDSSSPGAIEAVFVMKVSVQGAVDKAASPDGLSVWSSAAFPGLGKKQRMLWLRRSPGGPQPFSAGGYLAGGREQLRIPARGARQRKSLERGGFPAGSPRPCLLAGSHRNGEPGGGTGCFVALPPPWGQQDQQPPRGTPEPPCKREVAGQWWPSSWLSLSPEPQGLLPGPAPCSFLGSSSSQGGGGGRFCPLAEELEGSSPGWLGSGGW